MEPVRLNESGFVPSYMFSNMLASKPIFLNEEMERYIEFKIEMHSYDYDSTKKEGEQIINIYKELKLKNCTESDFN